MANLVAAPPSEPNTEGWAWSAAWGAAWGRGGAAGEPAAGGSSAAASSSLARASVGASAGGVAEGVVVEGRLWGGCLSSIYKVLAAGLAPLLVPSAEDLRGTVLFVETSESMPSSSAVYDFFSSLPRPAISCRASTITLLRRDTTFHSEKNAPTVFMKIAPEKNDCLSPPMYGLTGWGSAGCCAASGQCWWGGRRAAI